MGKKPSTRLRARINRGSFFRRKGLEADAASEWTRALKDYGNFEDGAVQQVLIKAAVYLELVRQTPREKLLAILLDRWGRSSDQFVHGELVHQILDRSLPWVTPPLGVSWLYFALKKMPRPKELAEGVAAYQLLDVESRKVFWEKAKGLEKKEGLALLANPVFLGLYDWELSLLEKIDQKYPSTRWECQDVGDYFKSPEEGVRALCQSNKNLSTWTDGKGRSLDSKGKSRGCVSRDWRQNTPIFQRC